MTNTNDKAQALEKLYARGRTTIFASQVDPRFSYGLFVPYRFDTMDRAETTLLVAMHGTGRTQLTYRDLFAEFAEYHNCIVIAPLFPAGVLGDYNLHGYKFIEEGNIRYDNVLLGILDEVSSRYEVDAGKVLMFGFSGGAHFTHRFTILHPDRIRAASVGAPGAVTLLNRDQPWWVGTGDLEERFGIRVDPRAYEGLPMHFVVGGADLETWEITRLPDDRYFMPGCNDSGATRIDRIRTLAASFEAAGARVRLEIVPGKTHDEAPMARRARDFFHDVLAGTFPR